MNFIQTDYFTYTPDRLFDGIVTDIPYKGAISHKLGEKEFDIDAFMQKSVNDTSPNAFFITFCNFLCAADIMYWIKNHPNMWQYHCYGIWNKEPVRNWIAWNYPLRSVEFILFLKKGGFDYCFKNGTTKPAYRRSSFGGKYLKGAIPNYKESAEGVYPEIFTYQAPNKTKVHPTQKPAQFSSVFVRITDGKTKYVLDPFCGSGSLLASFPNSVGIDLKNWGSLLNF